jgi:hypothetical protein
MPFGKAQLRDAAPKRAMTPTGWDAGTRLFAISERPAL